MTTVAKRFQVTAAAAAVAAGAAFAPVAANAAPAVQFSAAPVHQLVGDLREAPGDFAYFTQAASIQVIGFQFRLRSASLNRQITRLDAYAAANPGTFFGNLAAQASARKSSRLASIGQITLSACNGGTGIAMGPYGTVTSGPC